MKVHDPLLWNGVFCNPVSGCQELLGSLVVPDATLVIVLTTGGGKYSATGDRQLVVSKFNILSLKNNSQKTIVFCFW